MSNVVPPPDLRRAVTGHDANGRAVIERDGPIASKAPDIPGLDGVRTGNVWVVDAVPSTDNNNAEDGALRAATGALGLVTPKGATVMYTDLAPGATALAHRTNSIDFSVLVLGQLILYAEDESEQATFGTPGDVIVQRGTIHCWKNPGPGWTRWVSVLVDAEPAQVAGRALANHWNGTDM